MVVPSTVKANRFIPEKPRLWSDRHTSFGNTHVVYDVAPPGHKLAVLLDVDQEPPKPVTHLRVVTNLLKQ